MPTEGHVAPAKEAARRPIRALPALLVNQIAAGEVVERPASVVKELVDNALDAGATRISVELEAGGVELIRVTDDGAGIDPDQLPLALAPHATSKIEGVDDLDRIQTMGFRGEALASIASVSRLSIRSRTRDMAGATRLDVEGDTVTGPRPESGPVGTGVTVRNLFFNTPARRKFLRTGATEQGHCADVVRNLAAAHARTGFTLTADGRTLLDVPPNQPVRERALAILGPELESQLVEASADALDDARGMALWGLVGLPSIARPTNRSQRVFVNGRPIRDKTIQHALQEAYRGLIEPSRKPTAVLLIEMDPGAVDVNVHPTKAEVRFRDQGLVHSIVLRSVREALRKSDLTPSIRMDRPGAPAPYGPTHAWQGAAGGQRDASNFVEAFRRMAPGAGEGLPFAPQRPAAQLETRDLPGDGWATLPPESLPLGRPVDRILQVHKSYLVTEDAEGVVIIDQHALHERVMFEQLLERVAAGPLERQRLLTPAVLRTSPQRVDLLGDLGALLARLGIEAEPMGPRDIAVHAFPTFLFAKRVEPQEFLEELLERAEDDSFPADEEAALRETLDMMACKAAVKAGDHLSESELAELVSMRERVDRSSNCPHGRPTSVRLTIRQLEKLFGRT